MDKKEKIKKLLEMQKKFIELDRVGVEPEEYFAPKEDGSKHTSQQPQTHLKQHQQALPSYSLRMTKEVQSQHVH